MVLCQVYVNAATPNLYNINVFGKKKVKIVKIDYRAANAGNPVYHSVRLLSSILRVQYSNVPYFMFHSNPAYQIDNIHGDLEMICNFNGNLDIELFDNDTNARPQYFVDMILQLDITDAE